MLWTFPSFWSLGAFTNLDIRLSKWKRNEIWRLLCGTRRRRRRASVCWVLFSRPSFWVCHQDRLDQCVCRAALSRWLQSKLGSAPSGESVLWQRAWLTVGHMLSVVLRMNEMSYKRVWLLLVSLLCDIKSFVDSESVLSCDVPIPNLWYWQFFLTMMTLAITCHLSLLLLNRVSCSFFGKWLVIIIKTKMQYIWNMLVLVLVMYWCCKYNICIHPHLHIYFYSIYF